MARSSRRLDIVTVELSQAGKRRLDEVSERRGMTIKALLGRLISFFGRLDRTQQAVVLGQLEETDVKGLAALQQKRR